MRRCRSRSRGQCRTVPVCCDRVRDLRHPTGCQRRSVEHRQPAVARDGRVVDVLAAERDRVHVRRRARARRRSARSRSTTAEHSGPAGSCTSAHHRRAAASSPAPDRLVLIQPSGPDERALVVRSTVDGRVRRLIPPAPGSAGHVTVPSSRLRLVDVALRLAVGLPVGGDDLAGRVGTHRDVAQVAPCRSGPSRAGPSASTAHAPAGRSSAEMTTASSLGLTGLAATERARALVPDHAACSARRGRCPSPCRCIAGEVRPGARRATGPGRTPFAPLRPVHVGDRAVRADRHEAVVVVAVGRSHRLRAPASAAVDAVPGRGEARRVDACSCRPPCAATTSSCRDACGNLGDRSARPPSAAPQPGSRRTPSAPRRRGSC